MTLRYHLRTLLIVLALGPPMLAGAWATVSMLMRPEPQPFKSINEWLREGDEQAWQAEMQRKARIPVEVQTVDPPMDAILVPSQSNLCD